MSDGPGARSGLCRPLIEGLGACSPERRTVFTDCDHRSHFIFASAEVLVTAAVGRMRPVVGSQADPKQPFEDVSGRPALQTLVWPAT
jgi:hypothetical protein